MITNQVQLIGNVGQEPTTNQFDNGQKVVKISIATNEYYNDQAGVKQQNTHWHNIVAFGKTADIIEKYVSKGSKVGVLGKLSNRSYTDKNGTKKYITEVVANEVLLLEKQA